MSDVLYMDVTAGAAGCADQAVEGDVVFADWTISVERRSDGGKSLARPVRLARGRQR
jgi:hypothetical protein